MHEVSVVADLIAAIKKELEKYNVLSVKEVTILVGKLTNLGIEQMEFAYEVMSKNSMLEGSKLVIETENIIAKCEECGYKGPVKNIGMGEDSHLQIPILSCPVCNSAVTVTAGKSCCIKSIDIEEAR